MSIRTAFREAFPGRTVRAARKVRNSHRAGSIHCWRHFFIGRDTNCGNATSRAEAIVDIERICRFHNIGMALGNHIYVDYIDGWRKESDLIGVDVNWVHTKFMLIDPLGNQPITLTGSANFSEASVNTNDENMVLISGDKCVADNYFGKFMRVFAHNGFRESVKKHIEEFGSAAFNTWKPQDLFDDWKKWVLGQFRVGSEHEIKRRHFVG